VRPARRLVARPVASMAANAAVFMKMQQQGLHPAAGPSAVREIDAHEYDAFLR
jgi:hypothetical protein